MTAVDTILIYLFLAALGGLNAGDGGPQEQANPVEDARHCESGDEPPKYQFQVLPGDGWDNLRNKATVPLVRFNYSRCRTTSDGRYLVPDTVYTVPVKSSEIDFAAELIEHWDNYTSTLSKSINAHAGLHLSNVGISGKFSKEYENVKTRQFSTKSATTRTQARYVEYNAKIGPDTQITEAFQRRLLKIAADIMLNRTNLAQYESQLLVRDFGTHVTTSVDVGATMLQVDELSLEYLKKYSSQKKKILASASASFFKVFGISSGASKSSSKEQIDEYQNNRTFSEIRAFGGPVFRPGNVTWDRWTEGIDKDQVALDRSGDPIFYLVTEDNLPGVPRSTVFDVYDQVKKAVELYYETNTYRGCTKRDSPNFSFQANLDDGSCKAPTTFFDFGGVYQTCEGTGVEDLCKALDQKNPLSGDYRCPEEYQDVQMETRTTYSTTTKHECRRCFRLHHCCRHKVYRSSAKYTAHWCAGKTEASDDSGLLFGGLYSRSMDNVMTQSKSCPLKFFPLTFLGMTVCVSDDFELGSENSLPFGGFYSCNSGNPWASKLLQASGSNATRNAFFSSEGSMPHRCPAGFSQHHAAMVDGCSINFCVKSGALVLPGLPKIQRPPFMDAPKDDYSNYDDGGEVIVDETGERWSEITAANNATAEYLGAMEELFQKRSAVGDDDYRYDRSSQSRSAGNTVAVASVAGLVVLSVIATLTTLF